MIKSTDNFNVHVSPFYFVAQCVNRPSNYSCECDSGFEGDGTLGCTGKLSIGLNLLSKLLNPSWEAGVSRNHFSLFPFSNSSEKNNTFCPFCERNGTFLNF